MKLAQRALLIGMLLLFPLSACDRRPPAGPLDPLKIGVALQPNSALLIIALEQHLFREEGLEVQVTQYPSGKRALQEGLATGQVEMVSSSDVPFTRAILDGKPFKAFTAIGATDNLHRIVGRRDRGINAPGDLRGKRIGTQRDSAVHFFLWLFLLEQGIALEEVELVYLQAEELPAALARSKLDAISMREPYVQEAQEALGEDAVTFAAPGLYLQEDMMVTDDRLIETRPEVLRRVLLALRRAQSFAQAHPQQARSLTARWLGMPEGSLAAPEGRWALSMDQSLLLLLEAQARWLQRDLPEPRSVDFSKALFTETLRQEVPEACRIFE